MAINEDSKGKNALNFLKDKGSAVLDVAVDGGSKLKQGAVELKRNIDTKRLGPVYENEIEDIFNNPAEMIYITEDPKFNDNPVMENAIARKDDREETTLLTIHYDHLDKFNGLKFFPHVIQGDVFYVDPFDSTNYISLDVYFDYCLNRKVSELGQVAQKLGATEMSIQLKREEKSFVNKSFKTKANNDAFKVSFDFSSDYIKNRKYEVLSEMTFAGQEPERPDLIYLKNEPEILTLIDMRLDDKNYLGKKTYTLKYNRGSGITKKNAANIDFFLKNLKLADKSTITQQVNEEEYMQLIYTIVFP